MSTNLKEVKLDLIENLGYSFRDLKNKVTPAQYREFGEWLRGQTCGIASHGETVFYPVDWERFIQGRRPLD